MELSGRAHLREWRRGAPLTWLDHNTERKNTHTRTPTPYDMQSPIPAIHPRSSWFWPTRREMSGVSPPALSYATSGDISSPDGSWFCVCRRKLLVIPHERRCQNLKIARLSGYEKIIPRFVGMRKRPDGTSCGSLSLFDACVSCFAEENFTGILHTKIASQNDLGRSITRVVVPKKIKSFPSHCQLYLSVEEGNPQTKIRNEAYPIW